MIDPWTWLLIVLASWQILDTWFNGAILANWRAAAETWQARDAQPIRRFLGELLGCSFCLSHYPPVLCLFSLWGLTMLPVSWPATCAELVLAGLAATRVITALDLIAPVALTLQRPTPLVLNTDQLDVSTTDPDDNYDDGHPGSVLPGDPSALGGCRADDATSPA